VDVYCYGVCEGVEKMDRVIAAISGEMAVVAVDHGQAGGHISGKVEGAR